VREVAERHEKESHPDCKSSIFKLRLLISSHHPTDQSAYPCPFPLVVGREWPEASKSSAIVKTGHNQSFQ
jgi:hypothetical protein